MRQLATSFQSQRRLPCHFHRVLDHRPHSKPEPLTELNDRITRIIEIRNHPEPLAIHGVDGREELVILLRDLTDFGDVVS